MTSESDPNFDKPMDQINPYNKNFLLRAYVLLQKHRLHIAELLKLETQFKDLVENISNTDKKPRYTTWERFKRIFGQT